MVLLDTNVCIRFLKGSSAALRDELRSRSPTSVRLCSVVLAELFFAARHSERVGVNLRAVERFRAPFVSLPFDDVAAEHDDQIRAELTRSDDIRVPARGTVVPRAAPTPVGNRLRSLGEAHWSPDAGACALFSPSAQQYGGRASTP